MFAVIFFGILSLAVVFWWWAHRRARRLPRPWAWQVALALFVVPQIGYAIAMVMIPGFRQIAHHYVPPAGLAVMYIWHLLVLPVWAMLALLGGLVALGLWVARRARGRSQDGAPDETRAAESERPAPAFSRRQLLAAAAITAPPLSAIGLAGIGIARLDEFRIRSLDVPIANLSPALDGLTIAHVTDTHVGRYTRGEQLARIAEATNRLKADLVMMTGDLLDGSFADLPEAIDFMKLLDPRQGLAMVEGNHDLFGGPAVFRSRLKAAGLPLLVQESMSLEVRGEQVQVLGAAWCRGEEIIRQTVDDVMRLRDPRAFTIFLAHHPHAFDYAAPLGVPLTLAGHTHGGQLMLNERLGAGPAMFRYWTGLYESAASKLVVCNGAGNWFPLRTAAPAEIIHLTLRRA